MTLDHSITCRFQKWTDWRVSKVSLARQATHMMQNPESRRIDIPGGPVTSLFFFADGKHIMCGCKDGSIRQWRVSDWLEIKPVIKPDAIMNSIAVSPDGKWIASGGVDCKVTIWNATNHQKASESAKQYQTKVTALDVSPDSSFIAAGSEDGLMIVWRLESGEFSACPLKLRHPGGSRITSIKFSPSGDHFASACSSWAGDAIRVWDSCTGHPLACLPSGIKPTYSLIWSHDGQRLFAGGQRGSIRSFDIVGQSSPSAFHEGHGADSVTYLSISNNDRFLVAGSASGCSLSVWDVNTCQRIRPIRVQPTWNEVTAVAISPDDQHLFVGTIDKKISILSLSDIVPATYFFHVCILLGLTTLTDFCSLPSVYHPS